MCVDCTRKGTIALDLARSFIQCYLGPGLSIAHTFQVAKKNRLSFPWGNQPSLSLAPLSRAGTSWQFRCDYETTSRVCWMKFVTPGLKLWLQTSGINTSSVRTCEPTLNHMQSYSVPWLCLNNHPIIHYCCLLKCSSSSCSRHYLSDDIWLTSYTNGESDIQNLALCYPRLV